MYALIFSLFATAKGADAYLGPSAVAASRDGETLFVANADARQIAVIRIADGKIARSIDMPSQPSGLVLGPDGTELYVTCAAARSTVCAVDAASGRLTARIAVGHTATGPAVSPDGKQLYVCNRFDNDVSVVDLKAGEEIARVAVDREPIAAAVTPDGESVLIANHLPNDRANSFAVAAELTVIDARTRQTVAIRLPNGSSGLRGLCISPDGKYAFVTHVLSNYELVPSQVEFGWTNTNALSIVKVAEKEFFSSVLLDDQYRGAANPWGVACSDDGRWICVAHAGTHELSVVALPALLEKLNAAGNSVRTGRLLDGPSILAGIRRRVELSGAGPRGLTVAGAKACVAEYFSDTVSVVDLAAAGGCRPVAIALGSKPRMSVRRRGEMLFNDATICYQQWQSCASCHPDARADGLNWDLANDAVGNPKNGKSLLLAHKTPPAMASGIRPSAEAAVRSGIKHILFADRPDRDAAAIDEYLRSLRPVPSPYLVDGRLSPAARRGKKLFHSDAVGCCKCHPPPLYTDRLIHDTGFRGPYDFRSRFDTPALIEVWRTAPYMHDGRYATIRELVEQDKHGEKRGSIDGLSRQQIDDLVEFVLSL